MSSSPFKDFANIGKKICTEAIILGSTDNVTAVIVDLKWVIHFYLYDFYITMHAVFVASTNCFVVVAQWLLILHEQSYFGATNICIYCYLLMRIVFHIIFSLISRQKIVPVPSGGEMNDKTTTIYKGFAKKLTWYFLRNDYNCTTTLIDIMH